MTLFHSNFFSEVIGVNSSMDIILPDPKRGPDGKVINQPDRKFRVVYLLHGFSDDHTIWQRRTSIERYVEGTDIAVVMPAVHRSFYNDMARGYRYWTFISEEIPALVESWFPISSSRDDRYTAGLSMGGYGAFKLALRNPDRFGAAASLSGALDMRGAFKAPDKAWRTEMQMIFGNGKDFPGSNNDLFALAEQLSQGSYQGMPLYQWCGTEDFLYADNLRFRDHALALGLNLTYEEGPGGHEWSAWDLIIQRFLKWLPPRSDGESPITGVTQKAEVGKSKKKKKKGGKKKK